MKKLYTATAIIFCTVSFNSSAGEEKISDMWRAPEELRIRIPEMKGETITVKDKTLKDKTLFLNKGFFDSLSTRHPDAANTLLRGTDPIAEEIRECLGEFMAKDLSKVALQHMGRAIFLYGRWLWFDKKLADYIWGTTTENHAGTLNVDENFRKRLYLWHKACEEHHSLFLISLYSALSGVGLAEFIQNLPKARAGSSEFIQKLHKIRSEAFSFFETEKTEEAEKTKTIECPIIIEKFPQIFLWWDAHIRVRTGVLDLESERALEECRQKKQNEFGRTLGTTAPIDLEPEEWKIIFH